ncbi:uncharacterized protein BYT42DRAFT_587650 [Radiomyces spectabilis]|uniref:uncharacterized protein n=1 Tax=Radiomyces spectabilis TaxID=64574 RepID=UPI00221E3942|nr:uncharacterized protein BYT42DRAFT_587650 [Radiomyces spectabilis]KAI8366715.1 hypothetical protein BYT42DRAFT_587650 [Radiomyces spectabilis]
MDLSAQQNPPRHFSPYRDHFMHRPASVAMMTEDLKQPSDLLASSNHYSQASQSQPSPHQQQQHPHPHSHPHQHQQPQPSSPHQQHAHLSHRNPYSPASYYNSPSYYPTLPVPSKLDSPSTLSTNANDRFINHYSPNPPEPYAAESPSQDEKQHVCTHPNCQRRFKRLEHLKRHMRIHTSERPFQCTYAGCQKSFSRSDNLTQHLKTHERRGSRYHHHLTSEMPPPNSAVSGSNGGPNSLAFVDFMRTPGYMMDHSFHDSNNAMHHWRPHPHPHHQPPPPPPSSSQPSSQSQHELQQHAGDAVGC